MAHIVTAPAAIEGVRLAVIEGRLKLEMAGLKFRGGSTFAYVKRSFGFRGNRQEILAQFQTYRQNYDSANGFERPA